MQPTTAAKSANIPVDLSTPDNTNLVRGRSLWIEALWILVGAPIVASKVIVSIKFRCWLLRLFGADIGVNVHMKPGVRVKFPWYLSIGDHCWIGEDVWFDNLAPITIAPHVCVSQGAYLCTGNYDWTKSNMRLFSRPIILERGSWVGARSVVSPGVTVGEGAVLTIGSVAIKSLASYGVYMGNPAVYVRDRVVNDK